MFNEEYYTYVIGEMEKKLKTLMSEKEFVTFTTKIAREGFREYIKGLPDSDFKKCTMDHFEEITGEGEE